MQRQLAALGVASYPIDNGDAKHVSMAIKPTLPVSVGALLLLVSTMGGVGAVLDPAGVPGWAFDTAKAGSDAAMNGFGFLENAYKALGEAADTASWAARYWWAVSLVVAFAAAGLVYWRMK
jgi:hypothetical protein